MPVYRSAYPKASLIGIDISKSAIAKCAERYGNIARFIQGTHTDVPDVDIIITSNIFEHLSNDIKIASHLLTKCHDLFIITPYKESLTPGTEHINSYDENYFRELGPYDFYIFFSKGWGPYGWRAWVNIYMKNVLRPFFGKKIAHRAKQIMFHFKASSPQ
jgi:hypothetical protein